MYCQDKTQPKEKYLNRKKVLSSSAVTSISLTKKLGKNLSLPCTYVMKSGTMIFMWQYNTHLVSFLSCIAFTLDKKMDAMVSLPPPSGEQFVDNKYISFRNRRELSRYPITTYDDGNHR